MKKEKLETAKKLFKEGKTFGEIGEKIGEKKGTVHYHLTEKEGLERSISEAQTGKEIEWADKISESLKGHEVSDKTREKLSDIHSGKEPWNKNLTAEESEKVAQQGSSEEEHWNWKGGKSRERNRLRQTPKYKEWRTQVFERDSYTCQECGQKGGELNAHHIKEFSEHEDLRFDTDNGKTLCKECHEEVHR